MTRPIEQLLTRTFIDFQQTTEVLRHPLIVNRAEGLYFWDTQGKRYFDAIGGVFVAILGHRHPRVIEAMHRQMDRITFAPPLHGICDVTLEFVEKVGSIAPANLTFVKPFSGGSESIEAAIKFVRQYHKQTGHPSKYKIVSRYQGYHGGTYGAMAASGTGSRKSKFEPMMTGFLKVFPPTHYRGRFPSWDDCNRFAAESFEDVIVHEDPETVAAMIVEPIGNTGGIITPTPEYFRILRDIATRHNVILIFDEVITGYGRTGQMFAAQTFGVTPDIICGGKALSSGMIPLGAMIARQDMGDAFLGRAADNVQFAHGHTYAGNPLACAAGIAVIDEIIERDLCRRAVELGGWLRRRLQSLGKFGVVREVRGEGLLLGVELMKENGAPFPELGTELKRTSIENGIILRVDPTWFAVGPALTATEQDLDEMCGLIEKSLAAALDRVTAAGVPASV